MGINDWIKNKIQGEIKDLMKSEADLLPEEPIQDTKGEVDVGRKAIIDDPFFDNFTTSSNVYQSKLSRLSNKTLKQTSLRDWLVSSIIQIRCDTALLFGRVQKKKFETGFRFIKKDCESDYTEDDKKIIASLDDYILNCGRTDNTPAEDKMQFNTFMKLVVRDFLTFGHMAVEKVMTRGGALHRFRPLPAENVYRVNKNTSNDQLKTYIKSGKNKYMYADERNKDLENQQLNEPDISKYKYVQVSYDDSPLAAFGDEDLIFKNFNPQNFSDTAGYCYSPLEMAIINVTQHLNTETFNANFFTHGYAARGVLHLQGTVTQSQLINFRRQFYNSINGSNNAWRTPIVSGLEKVEWIPISGNARDMEYQQFNNHLMRAICTQFQIDPIELNLDFLSSATGRTSGQGGKQGNESKIEYSREKGLLPILMFIEDFINLDILPLISPDYAAKYTFKFEGYSDDTPQTDVALQQAQMTVFKSMNDLLRDARKQPLDFKIADLPMNAAFWQMVNMNMTRGEIREQFLGDQGASKRRELAYIGGDAMFIPWQQQLMAADQMAKQEKMQKEQMAQAQEQQKQQAAVQQKELEHAEGEHQRQEEAHHTAKKQQDLQAAHAAVNHGTNTHDILKQAGATKANNIGGRPTANPLNQLK